MFYPPGNDLTISPYQFVGRKPWVDDNYRLKPIWWVPCFLVSGRVIFAPPAAWSSTIQRSIQVRIQWMAGNLDLNKNHRNFRIPMPTPLQDITKALLGDYVTMMVNNFYLFFGGVAGWHWRGFPFNSHHWTRVSRQFFLTSRDVRHSSIGFFIEICSSKDVVVS